MLKSIIILGICGFHIGIYTSAQCPSGWVQNESICYFYSHDAATWEEASAVCKSLASSKLAEPKTNSAAHFISGAAQAQHRRFWIGITDIVVEDQWIYPSDLSQILVTYWGPNQPDNANGENCVLTWAEMQSKWADYTCSAKYSFICERPVCAGDTLKGNELWNKDCNNGGKTMAYWAKCIKV